MLTQVHDMPIGWPLGLGNMNMRLNAVESLQAAGEPELSLHVRSTSFSSFSSSDLDTESTASFFQDNSVSLGRLIGIRPGNGGSLCFPNTIRIEEEEHERKTANNVPNSEVCGDQKSEMTQGICIPQLLGILVKLSRSKSTSRG